MTPRERMLRAVDQEAVDRMPVCTYNCHPFSGSPHAADAGYAPILEAIGRTSAGCLCKVGAARHAASGVSHRSWMEGADAYRETTWQTPLGALVRLERTPEGQPSLCVKAFVESDGDVEKFMSLPRVTPRYDVASAVKMAREIGDKGLAYLPYGDPFYQVASLFHPEDLAIRTVTDFARLREMVDRAFAQIRVDVACLLDALAAFDAPFLFFTVGPELATPPLLSPNVFRDLVVPYQSQLVAMIHARGYRVSLHCHGRVREIFPHALQCGFDVIEPLEPPPQGNVDLHGLTAAAGDAIALMGYVQDQDFYLQEADAIRAHVRMIAELTAGRTGYICCPTCTPFQHPPGRKYVDNYVAFLEAAEACGAA